MATHERNRATAASDLSRARCDVIQRDATNTERSWSSCWRSFHSCCCWSFDGRLSMVHFEVGFHSTPLRARRTWEIYRGLTSDGVKESPGACRCLMTCRRQSDQVAKKTNLFVASVTAVTLGRVHVNRLRRDVRGHRPDYATRCCLPAGTVRRFVTP